MRDPFAIGHGRTDASADDITAGSHADTPEYPAARFFAFEADIAGSLRRFPMAVRHKLDVCGVHLGLEHWQHLPLSARNQLLQQPAETPGQQEAYREVLGQLEQRYWVSTPIARFVADPCPAWEDDSKVPDALQAKLHEKCEAFDLSLDIWRSLSVLERFALLKLSRPGRSNRGFQSLVAELFGARQPVTGRAALPDAH